MEGGDKTIFTVQKWQNNPEDKPQVLLQKTVRFNLYDRDLKY